MKKRLNIITREEFEEKIKGSSGKITEFKEYLDYIFTNIYTWLYRSYLYEPESLSEMKDYLEQKKVIGLHNFHLYDVKRGEIENSGNKLIVYLEEIDSSVVFPVQAKESGLSKKEWIDLNTSDSNTRAEVGLFYRSIIPWTKPYINLIHYQSHRDSRDKSETPELSSLTIDDITKIGSPTFTREKVQV